MPSSLRVSAKMGYSNLNSVIWGLLLPAIVVGQHVVTVSVGICLPGLESTPFIATGGPGPFATGVLPATQCVIWTCR